MSAMLEGKVVVVTGAGGGIGAEIAKLAAGCGARVVVNDAGVSPSGQGGDATVAGRLVEEILSRGGQAIASVRSVADWDQAHGIIQDALDAYGRVDVVVNNAGILRDVIFHKMTREQFDAVDEVNLRGVFYVSRAAAPHFKQQQSGCYVHMTSTSGLIGNLGQVNYGAAKMGVAGLSRCIALDMQRFGVTSNAIAPFAWTRMVAMIPESADNARRLEAFRQLKPERIAPLVVALASESGRRTTGQIFGVRNNEIYLFNQPRPIRTAHTAEGWTPASIIERVLPAFQPSYTPMDRSNDVFSWDPV
jgi:NAD(P)-dependent dehydrogenase (short-subunit alcohol dehydrogenase family)